MTTLALVSDATTIRVLVGSNAVLRGPLVRHVQVARLVWLITIVMVLVCLAFAAAQS